MREFYGKDIFIDKNDQQRIGLKLFDVILCQVYINDSSKPQAYNIQIASSNNGSAGESSSGGAGIWGESSSSSSSMQATIKPMPPPTSSRSGGGNPADFVAGSYEGPLKVLPNGVGFVSNTTIR